MPAASSPQSPLSLRSKHMPWLTTARPKWPSPYHPAKDGITIVRATRATFCIESLIGTEQFHKNVPDNSAAAGPCPIS
jgi:hypothetical protein